VSSPFPTLLPAWEKIRVMSEKTVSLRVVHLADLPPSFSLSWISPLALRALQARVHAWYFSFDAHSPGDQLGPK